MRSFLAGAASPGPSQLVTNYASPTRLSYGTNESNATQPWSVAGTFRNFKIKLNSAPGVGKSYTYTVRINGSDTALTVTISGASTSATDTSNSASIAAGDTLTIKVVPSGTPTTDAMFLNLEFDSTNVGQSGYGFAGPLSATSSTVFNGLWVASLGDWESTASRLTSVAAAAGTLTRLDARQSAASGTAKSYTYQIYKNGVAQDGTGGTVDTRAIISGNVATTGSATFSLSVAAGDTFYIGSVPSGTPPLVRSACSVSFTASTDGESQCAGLATQTLTTGATNYATPASAPPGGWSASEVLEQQPGWVTTTRLTKFRAILDGSPGVGKSYTFSYRRNTASPSGTPSVAISGASTSGSDSAGALTIASSDVVAMREVPAGSPTARIASWCATQGVATAPYAPSAFTYIGTADGGPFVG